MGIAMDSSGSSQNVESRVHELNIKEEEMNIGDIKKEEELSVEKNLCEKICNFMEETTDNKSIRCELRVVCNIVLIYSDEAQSHRGFGSYLFAMSERVVKQSEKGQDGFEYKNPDLG
ncbi:putative metal-nicotianamine transporter YSL7 [Forsythia ovata]|uniref:Metal-nicotianamine transporter YSL7 n=1 Tax=Forsythia ovata TaxID=205694 RepID=A0ABD1QSE7_9LAMI